MSVSHCVHGTDPPVLHHLPWGTCVTERPPLRTCQRSSCPPLSPHWGHVSLSIPHCVHARDPPFLPHPPLGTCVSECQPLFTWYRSASPPISPTGDMCHSASPSAYMPEILLSSTIPHWGHLSISVPHCVHGTDPALLHHLPLGTCVTQRSPVRTCQRSSSPPSFPTGTCVSECQPLCTWYRSASPPISPTGDMCHSASPSAYMPEILLSSTIPHWGHLSISVPHCVHGTDPALLHHLPLGTCVTQRSPVRTCQRSSSPPSFPTGSCVSECLPLCTWYRSSSPPPSPTGDMCHSASPTAYMPEILLSSTIPHWNMCQ